MIWIYILTAILFAGIVGLVCLWYFKVDKRAVLFTCIMAVVLSAAILIGAGINQLSTNNSNKYHIAEYDEIILYYDVVDQSNDELLRMDYYQKCQKWNEKYENWLVGRESKWRSAFYGKYDFAGCDFIRLELRRD